MEDRPQFHVELEKHGDVTAVLESVTAVAS
jgi:hypothetical protein